MKPEEFESFLRETAPRLGYRWRPLNRRNIRRKIQRRMDSLRIRDPGLYRDRVLADPAERILLESLFRVTISRFFRNVSVWQDLRQVILEEVTCIPSRGLSAWCAGSAGGEEPYSLAMLLMSMEEEGEIGPSWKVVGTETHDISLVRAREGAYQWGSIREVPERMRERWFVRVGEDWILSDDVKGRVLLLRRDLLRDPPPGPLQPGPPSQLHPDLQYGGLLHAGPGRHPRLSRSARSPGHRPDGNAARRRRLREGEEVHLQKKELRAERRQLEKMHRKPGTENRPPISNLQSLVSNV